ncbi:hypothetical protein Dimus_032002, partial [Dionaea muscipula]
TEEPDILEPNSHAGTITIHHFRPSPSHRELHAIIIAALVAPATKDDDPSPIEDHAAALLPSTPITEARRLHCFHRPPPATPVRLSSPPRRDVAAASELLLAGIHHHRRAPRAFAIADAEKEESIEPPFP